MVRRRLSGDPSLVDRHVSRNEGTLLVGSDPGEWFPGKTAADYLRSEVGGSGGSTRSPGDIHAFSEGTVGWAVTRLTLTFPDGSSASPRWSAVFHKEDGDWKIVHLHAFPSASPTRKPGGSSQDDPAIRVFALIGGALR